MKIVKFQSPPPFVNKIPYKSAAGVEADLMGCKNARFFQSAESTPAL